MRVLVTGGAGFIGSHVARALTGAGHDVVAFDCIHPAAHSAPPPGLDGVPLHTGDVRDQNAIGAACEGVDVVVHQAAMVGMSADPADLPEYVGCNDLGTAVLLAAMASGGVRRLVLASSMVVYGEGTYHCPQHGPTRPSARDPLDLAAGRFDPRCPACGQPLEPGLVDEDAPLEPRSGYAATKLAQEHLAAAWARATGGRAVTLRYHNVYGPYMPRDTPYSGVAAIFRSAVARREAPQVFEDGGQRRDFVHVSDVAAANVLAVDATAGGAGSRAYNVASGVPFTVGDMAHTLAAATGGPPPVVTGRYRTGDVRHIVASAGRARDELGFVAHVDPDTGIGRLATEPLR